MESLIFGLIAVRYINHHKEPVLEETDILQPFDVQSLGYVYGATERSTRRSADRNEPQVAQAAS
jgi:hypothetical protein